MGNMIEFPKAYPMKTKISEYSPNDEKSSMESLYQWKRKKKRIKINVEKKKIQEDIEYNKMLHVLVQVWAPIVFSIPKGINNIGYIR